MLKFLFPFYRLASEVHESTHTGAAKTTFLIVEAVPKESKHFETTEISTESPAISSVVGFVELALTRDSCFALAADVPYREFRPKMTSLVVDDGFRRQGIASQLLAGCVAQSKLWSGHSELFLEVRTENTGARSFYEKMGFKECIGKSMTFHEANYSFVVFYAYLSNNLSRPSVPHKYSQFSITLSLPVPF